MTLTLDIPAELERRLTSEASRAGLPIEQYALRLLGEDLKPRTGAELVDYWRREGLIGAEPGLSRDRPRRRPPARRGVKAS